MEENIYNKLCIKCNQIFIGKGKGPDICPECDKHYCIHCGKEIDIKYTIKEMCDECFEHYCDQEEFEYYHERGN